MPPDLAAVARMRVVYKVPGMDEVEVRRDLVYREIDGTPPVKMTMDVYLPAGQPAGRRKPVVLLIHGGPVPVAVYSKVKGMGIFVSYGEMLAASGFVAVACNHFNHGWEDFGESADNIAAVVAYLRANAVSLRLDAQRLCLWAFSGGGPQLAPALAAPAAAIRCLVGYYPLLDLRPMAARLPEVMAARLLEVSPETSERFSPAACLAAAAPPQGRPPLLLARAGADQPWLNQAFDGFVKAALAAGIELELWNHAAGQHGFDVLDDVPRSRQIVARTIEFIRTHTGAAGEAAPRAGGGDSAGDETGAAAEPAALPASKARRSGGAQPMPPSGPPERRAAR